MVIVAKDTSHPATVQYILQGLCCDWVPDMELLLFDRPTGQCDASTGQRSSVKDVAKGGCVLWKPRVIRIFSVLSSHLWVIKPAQCCKFDILFFSLILYTQNPQCQNFQYCSLFIILGAIYKCWEWREGRLFAYELIMQFLIKNHWLYTFGPYFHTEVIESPREEVSGHLCCHYFPHSSPLLPNVRWKRILCIYCYFMLFNIGYSQVKCLSILI